MMLTMLADVARAAGLHVVEVDGWKTRGRPGGMERVQTVVCHHTANGGAPGTHPSLTTVINGRTGLAGPLSQFMLAKDGTVYVVAAGKCNHAGVVLKDAYSNPNAIGIEAEAKGVPGTAGDWPPEQMLAYARLCRALIDHFHLSVLDVRGHKEVCSPKGRKSDPDFDMTAFRERVANTNLEADVPLSTDDIHKIVAALTPVIRATVVDVLQHEPIVPNPVTHPGDPANSPGPVTWALGAGYQKTKQQGEKIDAILKAVTTSAPTT